MKQDRERKKLISLGGESKEYADKLVVHQAERVKVVYTNVDGLIGKRLVVKDYVEENKPGIPYLTETKGIVEWIQKLRVLKITQYIGKTVRD